ncbi:hypothetical protein [Kibdelosporangium philippinense]|uniref:hypothetical protein n=1 Tax=Kibdelosporangium philippinense TaxID=211113 RepID=UPI0036187626
MRCHVRWGIRRAGTVDTVCWNGTANGISAPRIPVVELNAETSAPIRQMMMAASKAWTARWP